MIPFKIGSLGLQFVGEAMERIGDFPSSLRQLPQLGSPLAEKFDVVDHNI